MNRILRKVTGKLREQSDSYEELFNKADEVLYQVKEHGKNGFKIQQE